MRALVLALVLSVGLAAPLEAQVSRYVGAATGRFVDVPYSAGNFTANNSMTWTVESGDQKLFQYSLNGKMMTVAFDIQTTTVAGTPSTNLNIAIPGGQVAAVHTAAAWIQPNWVIDSGTQRTSVISIDSGGTVIHCWSTEGTGGANWVAATNTTRVVGVLTFEVQ